MFKLFRKIKITCTAKITFCCFVSLFTLSSFHPYYVSVTEIKYKEEEKTLEVSCRMFTDNLENTLRKLHKKQVDILNPKDKKEVGKLLSQYVTKHLQIKVNGELKTLIFLGYEKEEDATWIYFEIKEAPLPKTILVENSLLYEYLPQQINMVHTEVKDKKQSSKVTNPDKVMEFAF